MWFSSGLACGGGERNLRWRGQRQQLSFLHQLEANVGCAGGHASREYSQSQLCVLSVTLSLFRAFSCSVKMGAGDADWFLMEDLHVRCWTTTHAGNIVGLGLPLLLLYVIGVPAAVFRILSKPDNQANIQRTIAATRGTDDNSSEQQLAKKRHKKGTTIVDGACRLQGARRATCQQQHHRHAGPGDARISPQLCFFSWAIIKTHTHGRCWSSCARRCFP